MQSHIYKAKKMRKGYTNIVGPQNSELRYIEFGILFLPEVGDKFEGRTESNEVVLTIFTGKCSIQAWRNSFNIDFRSIGERSDVFSGRATAVYLPPKTEYSVVAETPRLEIGVSGARSSIEGVPTLVKPVDVIERTVGALNWTRKVYTIIGENVKAERILVGETINPPGNWSSCPPHKHDRKTFEEAPLEEVYFYKIKPEQGFGLQRIYSSPEDDEPFDVVYVVENNDTIVIPRGYHPVAAAPGYRLYYLWTLAGDERRYGAWTDDPKHSWLRKHELMLREFLT
ncbi:MAG: 5-deoxy-glucuronate isomerase [Nitrososphaerota archaeon]|nr:5-deoxy-glucuronate isomerase [Candidatus Bathyarchaeota archaeon]MDW8048397.1 5-deoxy-glucuronate isomerase [Nitrososphaerota archaeon]